MLEVINEDSPEVKETVEKEIKQAELTKAAAKEKQEFMENLISAVSSNVLFKTKEDTKLEDTTPDGGMKELKEKYESLKVQGPALGLQLPDIHVRG